MTKKTAVKTIEIVQLAPTPSVQADRMLEHLLQQAGWDVTNSKKELGKFAAEVEANPVAAFQWSAKYFEAAATFQVGRWVSEVVAALRAEDDYACRTSRQLIQALRDALYGDVMNRARFPEHSTSSQSNAMSLCLNAKRAEWLEKIDRYIERLDYEG